MFDPSGRWLSSVREVRRQADRVALALMDAADADWSVWVIDVRDMDGRAVLIRAFTDVATSDYGVLCGRARRE